MAFRQGQLQGGSLTRPRRTIRFLVPGDIEQLTGGYGYARAVIAAWREEGQPVEHIVLPGDFPLPSARSLAATAAVLAALPPDDPVLIDGLAYGALDTATIAHCRAPITVLLHHPLGLETGLAEDDARRLIASENAALKMARHVVVTSGATERTVTELFGVPPQRITVAIPGTPHRPLAKREARPPQIICVASITPRKGHADLVDALATLDDLEWQASFAGSLEAAPDCAEALTRRIADAGLGERITLLGPLRDAALDALYRDASIFALASYYEGYGMVFAEALRCGLPIVGYRAGAVPDVVPREAGVLVEPGDTAALAAALRRLLGRRDEADAMARAAAAAGVLLPDWPETAEIVRAAVIGGSR